MRIGIVIYEGFDELDAFGPLGVFSVARELGGDFSAELVSLTPVKSVKGSHGSKIIPNAVFKVGAYDALLVTGGAWSSHSKVGTWGEVQRGDWLPILKAEADRGTLMMSVCTGALMLAHAGVIGTRRAATHHANWDDLTATGAVLVPERVVDVGDLITCGGVTSGLDLALWVLEREAGADLAKRVGREIEY